MGAVAYCVIGVDVDVARKRTGERESKSENDR